MEEFLRSMPATYQQVFKPADRVEHRRLIVARGTAPCAAYLWRKLSDTSAILCVIADNTSGLLSAESAALLSAGLSVNAAQIYCRSRPGRTEEAVNFFWVRHAAAGSTMLHQDEGLLVNLTAELGRLIDAGNLRASTPGANAPSTTPPPPSIAPPVQSEVNLRPEAHSGRCLLEVVTEDMPGLLLAITVALVRAKLEVVECELRTENGIARDRFLVAAEDGHTLRDAERAEVESAIREAILRTARHRT